MFEHLIAAPLSRHYAKSIMDMRLDADGVAAGGTDDRARDLGSLPLYVHIPFCKSLCPFCSFDRYLFNEQKSKRYYNSLWGELEMYAVEGYKFDSVHIGGGTPTSHMDGLLEFIDKVRATFGVRHIDVESTPNEVNDNTVESLRSAGVERLSIGVQSFDDMLLRDMGRSGYRGSDALERLVIASGKFRTVAIDLIFNFPSQTEEAFAKDVSLFGSSGADQATFYPLMPGPHKSTDIEKRFNERSLQNLSLSMREKRFYDIITESMRRSGYAPNSAWCFSKREEGIDEYIVDNLEYVGIGASSVSFMYGTVSVNSFSLDKYAKLISAGMLPAVGRMKLADRELTLYRLLTFLFGLRVPGGAWWDDDYKAMRKYVAALRLFGILRKDNDGFLVTERGMYYVSVMMREFLAALNRLRETCIYAQL